MNARSARPFARSALLAGALCVSALFHISTAQAVPRPPSDPWAELPVATLAEQPVSALQLSRNIKVWFEFNTLADVVKVAGESPLSHYEDDNDSYDWLCYDSDAHRQRLWFISDSDTGGTQRMVTSIAAVLVDASAGAGETCPLLPKTVSTPALDRAVWLGSKDSELAKKLGEPSSSLRDWLSFYCNRRRLAPRQTPNEDGAMDDDVVESSFLEVRLVDGRVVQLIAGKLTGQ